MYTAENFPARQIKLVDLFVGRFQPVTIAHEDIIREMDRPVIAVVRGNKTSKDALRNPFPFSYQVALINTVCPEAEVIEVKTGYVPDIIAKIRESGFDVRKLYCGTDRKYEYLRQITKINKTLSEEQKIICEIYVEDRTCSEISATMVRTSLRKGDFDKFVSLIPECVREEYKTMKDMIEDVGAGVTNTMGSGAIGEHPKPMNSHLLRRKTFSEFRKDTDELTRKKYKSDVESEEKRR